MEPLEHQVGPAISGGAERDPPHDVRVRKSEQRLRFDTHAIDHFGLVEERTMQELDDHRSPSAIGVVDLADAPFANPRDSPVGSALQKIDRGPAGSSSPGERTIGFVTEAGGALSSFSVESVFSSSKLIAFTPRRLFREGDRAVSIGHGPEPGSVKKRYSASSSSSGVPGGWGPSERRSHLRSSTLRSRPMSRAAALLFPPRPRCMVKHCTLDHVELRSEPLGNARSVLAMRSISPRVVARRAIATSSSSTGTSIMSLLGEQRDALDHVAELAHVARPPSLREPSNRSVGEPQISRRASETNAGRARR